MEIQQVPETMSQIYHRVLERDPDPQGLIWYGARLWRNEANVKDVVKDIGLSPEYTEKFISNKPTDEAVRTCYHHFLARDPDPEGLEGYQRVARVHGFKPVITGLLESEEYTQKFGTDKVPS
jgi:hypothetical protein